MHYKKSDNRDVQNFYHYAQDFLEKYDFRGDYQTISELGLKTT